MNAVWRWLGWVLPATPRERAAALWSFAYFFTLLAGYYVLRPLRDQMGIAGGVNHFRRRQFGSGRKLALLLLAGGENFDVSAANVHNQYIHHTALGL